MVKKILIVDDNPEIRILLIEALTQTMKGYVFVEAIDGNDALEKVKSSQFDLLIVDIMMPKMDGWDFANAIKSEPNLQEIPIIFLSAKTDEYSKTLAKISAVDFIEKPFEIVDVKEKIESILG